MDNDTFTERITRITPTERDVRYEAEARRMLELPAWQLQGMLVSLIKEAGYEPDMDTPDGWRKK